MKARLTTRVLLPGRRILMPGDEFNIVPGSVTGPEEGKHSGYCEILVSGEPERVYFSEFKFTEGALEIGRDEQVGVADLVKIEILVKPENAEMLISNLGTEIAAASARMAVKQPGEAWRTLDCYLCDD